MSEKPSYLFEQRIGLRKYRIEDEDQELIEIWKEEINKILDDLKTKKIQEVQDAMGPYYGKSIESIYVALEREGLDEGDIIMLAISLWVTRQMVWRGYVDVAKHFLKGGTRDLFSMQQRNNGINNCLDASVLASRMAKEFGVSGDVKTWGKGRFKHRYFQDDKGKVIDPWWGYERAGLFQNEKIYFEKARRDKYHDCTGKLSGSTKS